MTLNPLGMAVAAMLTFGTAGQSLAVILVQRSFDVIFEGDDPGEVFPFDLPFNPSLPSAVRFDGFFENLTSAETGVRYDLSWLRLDGTPENIGIEFMRLPASGRLPIEIDQPIEFTPDTVFFHVEGGGPADHFRFVGDFAIEQLPEPATFSLIAAGAVAVLPRCRRRD